MSHPAADYVGFLDIKQLGVLLLPPWWDASSSQGYPPPTFHQASLIICQDTFKSHKWPKENFSLRYQYNIKQTSNESKENIN